MDSIICSPFSEKIKWDHKLFYSALYFQGKLSAYFEYILVKAYEMWSSSRHSDTISILTYLPIMPTEQEKRTIFFSFIFGFVELASFQTSQAILFKLVLTLFYRPCHLKMKFKWRARRF
jgi:hypothetical protein